MKDMVNNGDDIGRNLTPQARRNYIRLLEYLSDPDRDWPCRHRYSRQILGYKKPNAIYKYLSPRDLTAIETQAMQNRIRRAARQRAMVRQALFKKAMGYTVQKIKVATYEGKITDQVVIDKHYPPDPVAAREFLDRVEGKVKDVREVAHRYEDLSDEELDAQIEALMESI